MTRSEAEAHRLRMQRRQQVQQQRLQERTLEKGLLLVHTGDGKGKTTAALGMVLRTLGHGGRVAVVQFIKGAMATGEEQFLRRFPDEVSFHTMGEGYTWETQNRERDIEKATLAWEQAKRFLDDPAYGLVVLDELNIALKYRYLDVEMVINDLLARPQMQHVVITGRGAPPELIAIADTVTDMTVVKHAFKAGIAAQLGTEW